jgi:hypothetical protein
LPLASLPVALGRGFYGPRGDGAWWPFVPLLGWLLTLAVIGLIVWLVVRRRPAPFEGRPGWWGQQPPWAAGPPRRDDALEIARARYARGEMSREEYLRVTSDLGGPPPGPEPPGPGAPGPGAPPRPPEPPRPAS